MFTLFRLKKPIGEAFNMDLDDTLNVKKALVDLGHMEAPEHGLTEFPDQPMLDGVKSFQREQGLKVDGVMKLDGPTIKRLNQSLAAKNRDQSEERDRDKQEKCARLRAELSAARNNRNRAKQQADEAENKFEDARDRSEVAFAEVQDQAAAIGLELAMALALRIPPSAPASLFAAVRKYREASAEAGRLLEELKAKRQDVKDAEAEISRILRNIRELDC